MKVDRVSIPKSSSVLAAGESSPQLQRGVFQERALSKGLSSVSIHIFLKLC